MRITDLIDVSSLRELNRALADALGLDMVLADADGAAITASGSCDVGSDRSDEDVAVVPVYVRGREVAAWHFKKGYSHYQDALDIGTNYSEGQLVSAGATRTACEVIQQSPAVQRESMVLVSLLGHMLTDYASANFALLERVREHSVAAVDATATAVRMQRMADGMPVGLLELDRKGTILWSNRRARETLGISEFESRGLAGPPAAWSIESIDGVPYAASWMRVGRLLVRGETVSGLNCILTTSRGRRLALRIDLRPMLSEDRRITRVMCAVCEAPEAQSQACAEMAAQLYPAAIEPLTEAWLQLDAGRRSLEDDEARISGRLEIVASLLRETVANLLQMSSGVKLDCKSAAAD